MNKNGTITQREDFTASQKSAVGALDNAYTDTVNTLEKNASRNAVVKGPNGKETEVNAGRIAHQLEKQVFTVNFTKSGLSNKGASMESNTGDTTVSRGGLRPPTGLYGITNASPQQLWEIAITHEGIHADAPWVDNMWSGVPYDLYRPDHQAPFNQAANALLDGSTQ